jgi:chorismate lyase
MAKKIRWHSHINHVNAPKQLRHWLTGTGSLTAKLIAHSNSFRVQRISQRTELCRPDEFAAIGLNKAEKVYAREVILRITA